MEKIIGWQILAVLLAFYILYLHATWRASVDAQVTQQNAVECYKMFANMTDSFGNLIGGNESTPTTVINWTLENP